MPPNVRTCGGEDGLDPARITPGSWEAYLVLCDDQPGYWSGDSLYPGSAVFIVMHSEPLNRPPRSSRIGGRPATIAEDGASATVDCGDYVLTIYVAQSHRSRYSPAELRKILEAITSRNLNDKVAWFDGTAVLPTS
jgi:hypothetical protein